MNMNLQNILLGFRALWDFALLLINRLIKKGPRHDRHP